MEIRSEPWFKLKLQLIPACQHWNNSQMNCTFSYGFKRFLLTTESPNSKVKCSHSECPRPIRLNRLHTTDLLNAGKRLTSPTLRLQASFSRLRVGAMGGHRNITVMREECSGEDIRKWAWTWTLLHSGVPWEKVQRQRIERRLTEKGKQWHQPDRRGTTGFPLRSECYPSQ